MKEKSSFATPAETIEDIKAREHIGRLTFSSVPFGYAYGEGRYKQILDDVNAGTAYVLSGEEQRNAVNRELEEQDKRNAIELARLHAQYNLKTANTIIGDLCSGILTALTDPSLNNSFAFFKEVDLHDATNNTDNFIYRLTISRQSIYKLAMGATVNEKGAIRRGFEDHLRPVREYLQMLLAQKVPEPMIVYSTTRDMSSSTYTIKQAKPIIIQRKYSNTGSPFNDAFDILLDPFFFPICIKKGNFTIDCPFFQTVAGLASVLAVGRKELELKFDLQHLPLIAQMHRINIFLQFGMSCSKIKTLGRDILQFNPNTERYNLAVNAQATVRELCPDALDKQKDVFYVRYRDFIHFILTATNCLLAGVRTMGICEEASKTKAIFPGIVHGAEFKNTENKHTLYLTAEKFSMIANKDYYVPSLRYINNKNEKKSNHRNKKNTKKDFERENPSSVLYMNFVPKVRN